MQRDERSCSQTDSATGTDGNFDQMDQSRGSFSWCATDEITPHEAPASNSLNKTKQQMTAAKSLVIQPIHSSEASILPDKLPDSISIKFSYYLNGNRAMLRRLLIQFGETFVDTKDRLYHLLQDKKWLKRRRSCMTQGGGRKPWCIDLYNSARIWRKN